MNINTSKLPTISIVVQFFIMLIAITACSYDKKIEKHTFISEENGLEYTANVLLPDGYDSNKTYPVIYLLDGYFWFDYLGDQVYELLDDNEIVDVILVGIEYEKYPISLSNSGKITELRTYDLTYPEDNDSGLGMSSGGAVDFYHLIKNQIIPKIEEEYLVDSKNRSLFGHSLAGYFSLFQMVNFNEEALFKNIASISPSIWWSDSILFDLESKSSYSDNKFNLYMGIGSMEGVLMNVLFDEFALRVKEHDMPFKYERYTSGHTQSARIGFKNALEYFYGVSK
ncbi:hypothetical protein KKB55_08800 [Myxococcota bacterium]|nr:hypothetical protein [Myxococcota bacterium]MBU1897839.1 hypothetical protein [Myxococcota bacterium]